MILKLTLPIGVYNMTLKSIDTREVKRKLLDVEMNYLRWSARVSRLE